MFAVARDNAFGEDENVARNVGGEAEQEKRESPGGAEQEECGQKKTLRGKLREPK